MKSKKGLIISMIINSLLILSLLFNISTGFVYIDIKLYCYFTSIILILFAIYDTLGNIIEYKNYNKNSLTQKEIYVIELENELEDCNNQIELQDLENKGTK